MTAASAVSTWVQILGALATPLVAALVAYIAWREWRTNRDTLKERLFERRMEVFRETQAYLNEIERDAKISGEAIGKFKNTHQNALFLFGPELQNYLKEIHNRSIDMYSCSKQLEGTQVGPELNEMVEKERRELKWFSKQLKDVIFEKFRPFMSFR